MVDQFQRRESEKTKRKLKAKAAKRAKLDPDTAQTALDVQQNGAMRIEEAAGESAEEGGPPEAGDAAGGGKDGKAKPKPKPKANPRKSLLIDGEKGEVFAVTCSSSL